ncbi:MAG: hypothetical protein WKH64_08070, partial [Chloroflexia bacterium]
IAAMIALGGGFVYTYVVTTRLIVIAAACTILFAIALAYPVRIALHTHILLDTAVIFGAVLILPPGLSMLSLLIATTVAQQVGRKGWEEKLFNSS